MTNSYSGAAGLCTATKKFYANVLKHIDGLNFIFKCVCISMCYLVMSPVSCDFLLM